MITLHVHPDGCDDWNGLSAEANSNRTDGPLGSLEGARRRAACLRDQNLTSGPVRIEVQSGRYLLTRPIAFGPGDRDLHFVGVGETAAVLDGSVVVTGWEVIERQGRVCWRASLAAHLAYWPLPRSLFVDGVRRPRTRWPRKGWLQIESVPDLSESFDLFDGGSRFVAAAGDFDSSWRNPRDIEALVNHLWVEERMPVHDYNPNTRLVTSSRRSIFCLKNQPWMGDQPCARFAWENVFEALENAGDWYADRAEAALYYLPKDGESPTTTQIQIPRLSQLVRVHGSDTALAGGIHFERIHFFGTDWEPSRGWGRWWDPGKPESAWRKRDSFDHFSSRTGPEPTGGYAAVPQGAHDLPGAISLESAAYCSFDDCRFSGLGFHAIDIREACQQIAVNACCFEQNGAGALKVEGSASDPARFTHHIRIADCTIRQGGQVYPSACGILVLYAQRCLIEHNEVCEQPYTGISVGWCWHFNESPTREIFVRNNHIHHLGGGDLSDMGGIYTLGVQPGTIIEGNHIHHVAGEHYGGWGLYLDEGSSFITVCKNLVHHTRSQCLHEHWGRQNRYTDNIFAYSDSNCVMFSQEERDNWLAYPPRGTEFMRNVLISSGKPFFVDFMRYLDAGILRSDSNIFLSEGRSLPSIWERKPWPGIGGSEASLDIEAVRASHLETNSVQKTIARAPDFLSALLDPEGALLCFARGRVDGMACGPREKVDRALSAEPSFKPQHLAQGFVD